MLEQGSATCGSRATTCTLVDDNTVSNLNADALEEDGKAESVVDNEDAM